MRPQSIVMFERLFLASLVLGLINLAFTWSQTSAIVMAVAMVFAIGVPIALWYFIARRASIGAKWILVVLTALGLLSMVLTLPQLLAAGTVPFAMSMTLTGLQVASIVFLFRRDAVAWLAAKGAPVENSSVFE